MTPEERKAKHDRFVERTRLRNLYRDWRPELESVLRLMRHGTQMDDALEQVGVSRPLFTEVLREHERQHRNRLLIHEQRRTLALAAIEAALPHPLTYSELAAALAMKVEDVTYLTPACWRERYPPDAPMAPDPEGRDWAAWGVEHDAPGARQGWGREQRLALREAKAAETAAKKAKQMALLPQDGDVVLAIQRSPGLTSKGLRREMHRKVAGSVARLLANGLVTRQGAALYSTDEAAAEAVAMEKARAAELAAERQRKAEEVAARAAELAASQAVEQVAVVEREPLVLDLIRDDPGITTEALAAALGLTTLQVGRTVRNLWTRRLVVLRARGHYLPEDSPDRPRMTPATEAVAWLRAVSQQTVTQEA